MDQEFAAGGNATLSGHPIRSGSEYIESLSGRKLKVYLFGELVDEPVDHPIIRPSINAVAETYDLASSNPELASAISPLTGERVNRFLHIATSAARPGHAEQDAAPARPAHGHLLPALRRHGRVQRAVLGDLRHRSRSTARGYHERFSRLRRHGSQRANLVIGGAMTDVKGDRSKAPHEQDDPDLFVRVVEPHRRRRRASAAPRRTRPAASTRTG